MKVDERIINALLYMCIYIYQYMFTSKKIYFSIYSKEYSQIAYQEQAKLTIKIS